MMKRKVSADLRQIAPCVIRRTPEVAVVSFGVISGIPGSPVGHFSL